MTYIVTDNVLSVNGKEVVFDHEIRDTLQTNGVIVVLLSAGDREVSSDNVYGVSITGDIIWRIETRHSFGTGTSDYFTGIAGEREGVVYLYHYSCDVVKIDPNTGGIIGTEFRK